jgi:hypothetical protein
MAELDQQNLKDGLFRTIRLAASSWGNLIRVSIILILAASIFARGWLVYTGSVSSFIPVELAKLSEKHTRPNEGAYEEVARYVISSLEADIIVFGQVDMGGRSSYTIKRVYLKDGSRQMLLEGYTGPFFDPDNPKQQAFLSALGSGDGPCGLINESPEDKPKNFAQSVYYAAGIKFRCGVSIPPEHGLFEAGMFVGWKDAAKAKETNNIKAILRIAASMATKKN